MADDAFPLRTSRKSEISFEENIAVGIDRKRPSVCGRCPWCEGEYAAGWLEGQRSEFTIRHTSPTCERFRVDARSFLTDARLAGVKRMQVGERYDA